MWFIIVISVLFLIYFLIKRQYTYWEDSGIPSLKSKFPFGNLEKIAKNERSFGTAIYDLYKQTTEPLLGIYLFFRPAILVNDRELVKNILTRDFNYFHNRGVYIDKKSDPMSANLFSLEGEDWKHSRYQLTPAFTSGKLKGMFNIIKDIGRNLVEHFNPLAENQTEIEIREFTSCYVSDCLASIAFGQEGISSIDNPDHEFRMNAKRLNDNSSIMNIIRGAATFICPGLLKILRIKSLPKFMQEFCIGLVEKTIDNREKNNVVRKDLIQYLIQLRNNQENGTDDEWSVNKSEKFKSLSYEEIAAHVFVFYIAGSDSSASAIAYTLYELTQNDELMQKAQNDVMETLEKHDGNLTYEAIMDMNFIDLCVKETLRKYPGLPILNRECTKDYEVPDSNFTIKKGTSIIISLLGLHLDEKFFPNPEKYDPERFSEERHDYDSDMYMPFGLGPRNCIAFRMGLVISKVAIVMLLLNYRFEAVTFGEMEFDYGTVALLPKPGTCKIKILKK